MKLSDIFEFKLFERTDKADLNVVNENFQSVETIIDEHKKSGDHDERYYKKNDETMIMDEVVEKIYPIGSIYISANNANPGTIFGGTWEQIKDTFLLSAGNSYEAGTTGGEANHKLTMAEIPSHNHSYSGNTGNESAGHTHGFSATTGGQSTGHTHGFSATTGTVSSDHAHTGTTNWGGSHDHDIYYRSGLFASGSSTKQTMGYENSNNGSTSSPTIPGGAHNHTFTTNGISANHTHGVSGTTGGTSGDHTHAVSGATGGISAHHSHSFSGNTGNTGSGSVHNNMPPYLVVYMWKRVK